MNDVMVHFDNSLKLPFLTRILGLLSAGPMLFLGAASAHPTTQPAASQPTTVAASDFDFEAEPCAEFKAVFDAAKTPLDRGRAGVEMARCLIVRECAPALSRELHRPGAGGAELVQRVTRGIDWLDKSAKAIDEIKKPEDVESREVIKKDVELLQTFGKVFAALGAGTDSKLRRDQLIYVCGDLSLYLDDSDHGIGESAKLWQAAAYRRAGRAERALQILNPILSEPADARIGFMARVERCRALLDQGHYAAAIALVQRLASRVDAWLVGESESVRKQASETLRFMHIDLLRAWEKSLREKNQAERAAEIAREWKQLLANDERPASFDRLLPLKRAVATSPLQLAAPEAPEPDRG